MPDRKMFWRIIRRLLAANRGRLFVILLALGAGAAVTAALLNLQVDAKRRLTTEFRAFGPNVIIAPKADGGINGPEVTLDQSITARVPEQPSGVRPRTTSLLVVIAQVSSSRPGSTATTAVLTGYDGMAPPGDSIIGLVGYLLLP